jgi:MtN3 and saliva related transmembrane protein|tara:strand:+ start:910 stop:1188 length:279 start_codon:yes stop_codon:yes gene_type:complete
MINFEIIGYLAGFIVAISLSPQLIKAWKTKSTKDISISWTLIYMTGLSLWVVYGIGIASWPIIVTLSIEFLMAFSLFILNNGIPPIFNWWNE